VLADQERAQAEQVLRHFQGEAKVLLEKIPEWSNTETAAQEQKLIWDYGRALGFSPQEMHATPDHRLVLAFRDAARYRALQQKKPQVQQRVSAVRPARPGAATGQPSKTTHLLRAQQRLTRTGNVRDAAAVLEKLLP
jgi:hypothetical protein